MLTYCTAEDQLQHFSKKIPTMNPMRHAAVITFRVFPSSPPFPDSTQWGRLIFPYRTKKKTTVRTRHLSTNWKNAFGLLLYSIDIISKGLFFTWEPKFRTCSSIVPYVAYNFRSREKLRSTYRTIMILYRYVSYFVRTRTCTCKNEMLLITCEMLIDS